MINDNRQKKGRIKLLAPHISHPVAPPIPPNLFLLLTALSFQFTPILAEPIGLRFEIKSLAVDANEGIAIADLNKDGKLDVAAGRNWYAGPEFISRPLRNIEDWNGYVQSNCDFAYDVDGDGWKDIVSGAFIPKEVHWYRNPGEQGLARGHLWKQNLLVDTGYSQNEGSFFRDMNGDGKPEWISNSWNKNNPMLVWHLSTGERDITVNSKGGKITAKKPVPGMLKQVIGVRGNGHGMGFGDINNDGVEDIVFGEGWYEGLKLSQGWHNPIHIKPWKLHRDWSNLHASVPMFVRDLDGDGRNDLIWGKGHHFGLQWWQQIEPEEDGKLKFKEHMIDKSYSQPHTLHMADLDGDGGEELITGKRVYAHNGRDPGGMLQPCIYYYKWNKKDLKFQRFTIAEGKVGTGLQICTADLDGDGKIDIAVAGKSGTYVLFNRGMRK